MLQKSENGFSYLEILLSLFILLSSVYLISIGMRQVQVIEGQMFRTSQNEWHIFLNQIENILDLPSSVECFPTKVILTYPQKKVVLECYRKNSQQMIRKVENGGHEPYLMNVVESLFFQDNGNVFLSVKMNDNKSYTALIYPYEEQVKIIE